MAELDIIGVLLKILDELLDGTAPGGTGWVFNPGDAGLLGSLDKLSARDASAVPSGGGASIAAHVDHLRYGLELMNRWNRGEDAFVNADYSASWSRGEVSEAEWKARRESLRSEAYAWREAVKRPHQPGEFELTGIAAGIAHLAYHLGAIRQINRSSRGPSAKD
ncbi:MAG TPA: DinB family protein [Edaphobacter sp.]|nr:DinB family protein [Edaphobacter sp.]